MKGTALMAIVMAFVQLLVIFLQWNYWPLSSFDMFAQAPPAEAVGYRLVFKGKKVGQSIERMDFSKVSFEIYNSLSSTDVSPSLDRFILKQASLFSRNIPFDIELVQLVQFRVFMVQKTGELKEDRKVVRELSLTGSH